MLTMLGFIGGILVGAIGAALVGVIMLGKDLFSISERLNFLYSQNLSVLSNMNNPAVSGLINSIAQQERTDGMNRGVTMVFLALYKLYDEGEFLDYESLSEGIHKALHKMNTDSKIYETVNKKFAEYNEAKADEENDD